MAISSRTPEGSPYRCPICGKVAALEPCPSCGHSLWFVRDRIGNDLGVNLDQISCDSLLDIKLDSVDLAETVMELEEEFHVTVPDEAAMKFRSVRDAIEYISRHRNEHGD